MKSGARKAPASFARQPIRALRERNARLQPAQAGTMRGAVWAAFIAYEFYLLSNPLAFQPVFGYSLHQATELGVLLALVELPRLRLQRPPYPLLVFAAIAGASWWWSMDRGATTAAFWLYGSIALLALLVASNASPRVLVNGFAVGGLLVLAASVYAWQQQIPSALIPPDMALDGYIAGVGTNRNILSYTMVLALGFLAGYHPPRLGGRLVWSVVVLLLLTGVFLAQSVTGFLCSAAVLVLGAGLLGLERVPRRLRQRIALAGFFSVVVAIGLMLAFPALLGTLSSRDSVTLSGRVPLWEAIVAHTSTARIEGFGWGTVWMHPWLPAADNGVAHGIYAGAGTFMSHGHNSFLDVLPQLGVLGVIALGIMHVAPLVSAMIVRFADDPTPEELLASRVALTSVTSLIVFGMTEPMSSTPIGWFVLCVVASLAGRAWPTRANRVARTGHARYAAESVSADSRPLVVAPVGRQNEVHNTL